MTTVIALALVACAAAPPPAEEVASFELAGLAFTAPRDAEVTTRELEAETEVVAITLKDEVLLLTVYRGKRAPTPNKALAVHLEETEKRLQQSSPTRTSKQRERLLRRRRQGWHIAYQRDDEKFVARLVAARRRDATVVASYTLPQSDLATAFSKATIRSVKLLGDR